jgi:hypothetical protein
MATTMPFEDVTTKYYKYTEPSAPHPPSSRYQLDAFEYRGFLLARVSSEFTHWKITALEGGSPPRILQGTFTTKTRAMAHVDDFWLQEEKNKAAAREGKE